MSDPNVRASEKVAVVGVVDPVAAVTTVTYTAAIDMGLFMQAMGIFLLGNMPNEIITVGVYPCNAAGNARGAAIKSTVVAAHATSNDNTQVVIGIRRENLLGQALYDRYVQFGIAIAGAGGPAAAVALGVDPIYGPGSDYDLASVTIDESFD